MDFIIRPLTPADADAALALLADCSAKGKCCTNPWRKRIFSCAFSVRTAGDSPLRPAAGWWDGPTRRRRPASCPVKRRKTRPLYLTLLLVEEGFRRRGAGKALLEAVRQAGRDAEKPPDGFRQQSRAPHLADSWRGRARP